MTEEQQLLITKLRRKSSWRFITNLIYYNQSTEINCTGNNGNGCYLDSCGHNCGCEGLKEFVEKLKTNK